MKKLNDDITKIAENVDRMFYFVSPENLVLKDNVMAEIAEEFAKLIEINIYAMRCGGSVQNPEALFLELNELSYKKFEIIYFSRKDGEVSFLSHDQKLDFAKKLNAYTDKEVNSGIVAKYYVDNSDYDLLN